MRPMRIALIALLSIAGTAVAADSALDAARRCAEIKDSTQRLACFDHAVQAPPASVPVQSAPRSAVPKVVAPAPVPALGDENLRRKGPDSKPEAPKSLTAKITSVKESRPGIFRVTLDNDQVWQATESKPTFVPAVGDAVQIDKGAMGNYQMARISPGRSGWVRVTRAE